MITGLVYEGQRLGGLPHGHGSLTWPDGSRYLGQVHHGAVHGLGHWQWPNGSVYAGQLDRGVRHGLGSFFHAASACVYTGSWEQGRREGFGVLLAASDTVGEPSAQEQLLEQRVDLLSQPGAIGYVGAWRNDERSGWGRAVWPSGAVYEGDWARNVQAGVGVMVWPAQPHAAQGARVYEGDWHNGLPHGLGCQVWLPVGGSGGMPALPNRYEGEWYKGQRHGRGVMWYADGSMYVGFWRRDVKQGAGVFRSHDGRVSAGEFAENAILDAGVGLGSTLTAGTDGSTLISPRDSRQAAAAGALASTRDQPMAPTYGMDIGALIHDELLQGRVAHDAAAVQQYLNTALTKWTSKLRAVFDQYASQPGLSAAEADLVDISTSFMLLPERMPGVPAHAAMTTPALAILHGLHADSAAPALRGAAAVLRALDTQRMMQDAGLSAAITPTWMAEKLAGVRRHGQEFVLERLRTVLEADPEAGMDRVSADMAWFMDAVQSSPVRPSLPGMHPLTPVSWHEFQELCVHVAAFHVLNAPASAPQHGPRGADRSIAKMASAPASPLPGALQHRAMSAADQAEFAAELVSAPLSPASPVTAAAAGELGVGSASMALSQRLADSVLASNPLHQYEYPGVGDWAASSLSTSLAALGARPLQMLAAAGSPERGATRFAGATNMLKPRPGSTLREPPAASLPPALSSDHLTSTEPVPRPEQPPLAVALEALIYHCFTQLPAVQQVPRARGRAAQGPAVCGQSAVIPPQLLSNMLPVMAAAGDVFIADSAEVRAAPAWQLHVGEQAPGALLPHVQAGAAFDAGCSVHSVAQLAARIGWIDGVVSLPDVRAAAAWVRRWGNNFAGLALDAVHRLADARVSAEEAVQLIMPQPRQVAQDDALAESKQSTEPVGSARASPKSVLAHFIAALPKPGVGLNAVLAAGEVVSFWVALAALQFAALEDRSAALPAAAADAEARAAAQSIVAAVQEATAAAAQAAAASKGKAKSKGKAATEGDPAEVARALQLLRSAPASEPSQIDLPALPESDEAAQQTILEVASAGAKACSLSLPHPRRLPDDTESADHES